MKQSEGLTSRVQRETVDLNSLVDRIHTDLNTEPNEADFMAWKRKFLARLRHFQIELLNHFEIEEEGGFMADVIATAPQHARKVDAFEHQHQEIVIRLAAIAKELEQMHEFTRSGLVEVRSKLREALRALRKHEEGERALIQRAYFQDIGTGG